MNNTTQTTKKHQAHCRATQGYVCCCVDKSTVVKKELLVDIDGKSDKESVLEVLRMAGSAKAINAFNRLMEKQP